MKSLHAGHLLRMVTRELTQEKQRLFGMLCNMLLAGLLLFCGLLSLSALLVIASWETPYRIHSLVVLMVLYLVGAVIAWRRFESLDRKGERALEKTRQELADTLQRIEKAVDTRTNAYPQSLTMQLLTQEPGLVMFLATDLLPNLLRKFSRRRARRRREEECEQES